MMVNSENNTLLFTASLLFRSSHNGEFAEDDLWEERIVLIKAIGEDEAKNEAALIGVSEECSYTAIDGTHVKWVFQKVERIFQILNEQPLQNGSELFSRFLRNSEVLSILTPFE